MNSPDAAESRVKTHFKCIRTFWVVSFASLIAIAFISAVAMGPVGPAGVGTLLAAQSAVILILTILSALGAWVALIALPVVVPARLARLNLASGALGLLLPAPTVFAQISVLEMISHHGGRSALAAWFIPIAFFGGPLTVAVAYFLAMRLLIHGGWLTINTHNRCSGCGYVIVKGTSDRCPECGGKVSFEAEPSPDTVPNRKSQSKVVYFGDD